MFFVGLDPLQFSIPLWPWSFGLLWCAFHQPEHHHLFRKSFRFRGSHYSNNKDPSRIEDTSKLWTSATTCQPTTSPRKKKERNNARNTSHGKSKYIDMHNGTNMTRYDDQKIHQPVKIWRTNPPTGWWFQPISKYYARQIGSFPQGWK